MTDSNSTIRAFFAIDLPKSVKEIIYNDVIVPLSKKLHSNDVKWISAENLHITLQFMSVIKMMDIIKIIPLTKMKLQDYKPFHLNLGPLELFPNEQKPKVISLAVAANDELTHLSKLLGNILAGIHFPVETRPFRGHLSLGKIHAIHQKFLLSDLAPPKLDSFLVKEITLFQSQPSQAGSLYIPLSKIQF